MFVNECLDITLSETQLSSSETELSWSYLGDSFFNLICNWNFFARRCTRKFLENSLGIQIDGRNCRLMMTWASPQGRGKSSL